MGGSSTISTTEPMVGALRVQQSTYGITLPVIFGRCRETFNLGWYGDFKAIAHTETTSQGGKGGGGVSQKNTTYTYEAAIIGLICEGPIAGVRAVWQGKKRFESIGELNLGLMNGDYGQPVWGYLSTNHPEQAIGYSGIAGVMSPAFQLTSNAEIENHTIEIDGMLQYNGGPDCNPRDVFERMLINASYGAGFPAGRLADTTNYSNYCLAAGILISIALKEQAPARDTLGELLRMTNTGAVWSGSKLKLVPYADQPVSGNGVTYTPNVMPEYDLTDDDFLTDGKSDPVRVKRKSPADRYNHVQIEFINAANGYNIETVDAKDLADIERNGLRTMSPIKFHALPNAEVAGHVAELILQRSLYICNEYEFKLGWNYILLEGMDIVTLTCSRTFLDRLPVRIISIEEDPDGDLTVKAEDCPIGAASAARYARQATAGYMPNYNAPAGNVNAPVMFEPPSQLVNGLEVWLAVSGSVNYGGCNVWVSYDGDTYKKIGSLYYKARQGHLTANLSIGQEIDPINSLDVDLSESGAQLLSGTREDARNLRTLCYVDGELIAYETAELTDTAKYSLSYLARGAYGTVISNHIAGSQFARLDEAVFRYPFSLADIGKTINIKFQSFNTFGAGMQHIEEVQPYTYLINGSTLNSALPNVANVTSNFVAGMTKIYWDGISDFRSPIDYEVRRGATWEVALLAGRTPVTSIPAMGNGTYWIAAHFRSPDGVDAYSEEPQMIVITGSVLMRNVVISRDESADGWAGAFAGGSSKADNHIQLMGAGNILDSDDILAESSILWLGGVSPSGSYEIQANHRIDVCRVIDCNVMIEITGHGQSIYDNVLSNGNILEVSDLLGVVLGQKVTLQPQIRTAGEDGIYGDWQNYVPGIYNARYFDARLLMASSDPQVTALVTKFNFAIDVPDRVDTWTGITIPAEGMWIEFSSAFNGGPGESTVPHVQATILNAQPGDYVLIPDDQVSLERFFIKIMNGASGVERKTNVFAQGY